MKPFLTVKEDIQIKNSFNDRIYRQIKQLMTKRKFKAKSITV